MTNFSDFTSYICLSKMNFVLLFYELLIVINPISRFSLTLHLCYARGGICNFLIEKCPKEPEKDGCLGAGDGCKATGADIRIKGVSQACQCNGKRCTTCTQHTN